ncbi:MAG: 50S ribosomal protein L29 [Chloroflexi bacterium]|nr:50S ribosomal protein L29 [Chloroflexota bacterium]MBI4504463.1 50S ribosomal protein L29 [Chloroflexota bacterium]
MAELRGLSDGELQKRLDETYEEQFKLRFQLAVRQLSNHRRIPFVRRHIARIKSIQRERELAQMEQSV